VPLTDAVQSTRGPAPREFDEVFASIEDVQGWMTRAQAQRLWSAAKRLSGPARIVEIGSYQGRSAIILSTAAAPEVQVIAIDPHGGNDRGPQQIEGAA
jgi:predicted O-methyltransferase YrrM